jgi:hypothetical protein
MAALRFAMFSYVNDPKTTLGWNMAHSVRDPRLQTRAARLRLPSTVRRKNGTIGQADPVYVRVGQGVSLGYRRNKTGGAWVTRAFNGKGGRITRNVESTEGPRLSLLRYRARAVERSRSRIGQCQSAPGLRSG